MSTPPTPAATVRITLNGEARAIPAGSTVTALLALLGLPAKGVAVALNGDFLPRGQHPTTTLGEGDQVECVAPMQGG